jgi:hypothetical protein
MRLVPPTRKDGIVVAERDGTTVYYWNQGAIDVFGRTPRRPT